LQSDQALLLPLQVLFQLGILEEQLLLLFALITKVLHFRLIVVIFENEPKLLLKEFVVLAACTVLYLGPVLFALGLDSGLDFS
jgi:hypothetical protein